LKYIYFILCFTYNLSQYINKIFTPSIVIPETKTNFTIVAGLCYSDEGKGRVIKDIGKKYDIIMRTNGSWSSSHQIDPDNISKCFHLPSYINNDKILIVNMGMYVNPEILALELSQDFRQKQIIYIHEDCPIILQNQHNLDESDHTKITSLGSGIRDAMIKRLNHEGITLNSYLKEASKKIIDLISPRLISDKRYREILRNKNVLVEGSHGYLIDQTFGKYPYTTSTNTTPSFIMALTGFSSKLCKEEIFVSSMFSISLGYHPDHKLYKDFGIEYLEDLIPDNIKLDFACGKKIKRNFGPLDLDTIKYTIENYPECKIIFNMFDIIRIMNIFYYIEDNILKYEKLTHDDPKLFLHSLLETKLNRRIYINDYLLD